MNTGPNPENLRRLAGMLPSMVQGMATGRIGGKGKPALRFPRWSCPACCATWGKPYTPEPPANRPCRACGNCLKAGGVIMVCLDGRFVRVKPKKGKGGSINPRYAGRVLSIPVEAMNRIHKEPSPDLMQGPPGATGSPAGESPPTSPQSE